MRRLVVLVLSALLGAGSSIVLVGRTRTVRSPSVGTSALSRTRLSKPRFDFRRVPSS